MKVTLEEEQIKELIKKYYGEVMDSAIDVGFSVYQDHHIAEVLPHVYRTVTIGGIKLKATEELNRKEFTDIIGYFLSTEYQVVNVSLSSYKIHDQRGDYTNHVRATVEVTPTNQKTLGRQI